MSPTPDLSRGSVYSQKGSPAFHERLHRQLQRMTAEVRDAMGDNLLALALGGGYGRGEGGVVFRNGEEAPYNDLDLVVVVRRKSGVPWDSLDAIRKKYERQLGIEIDFSRPLTVPDIRRWPRTMLWSDLLQGHNVLTGPPDILTAHAPRIESSDLPVIEATRLLLNRGAGLLWAQRVMKGLDPAPDADFVRRNYYKCALALGDALLVACGHYTAMCAGRDVLLARSLQDHPGLLSWDLPKMYQAALAFKFSPDQVTENPGRHSVEILAQRWGEIYLLVEQRRSGKTWPSLTAYAASKEPREPDQNRPGRWLRNFVKSRRLGMWSLRYPRELLYRELPILLGLTEHAATDWPARSARFLAIWKQVN
jgi:hypothetical protein